MGSDKARDEAPDVSDETLAALTEANRGFATAMYRALKEGDKNLFFSPHSISVALAMTWAGAAGDTETEMQSALGWSLLAEEDVHAGFNALDLALDSRSELPEDTDGDGFQLSIVNQTWGQRGFGFEDPFLDVLATQYGAALYLLDFQADPEGSREAINDWVEEVTEDRIVDLLPEGAITDLTRLVLANAIYFKASWSLPFELADTADGTFVRLDGSAVTVPMMNGVPETAYASGDGWALVELPYVGEELDMTLIVPDAGRFEEIEAGLDQPFLDEALAATREHRVTLSMPRFSFKTEADLVDGLVAQGMVQAFDADQADFTGMSTEAQLYVSGVFHQAFVAVNEEGTEAAAATAVVIGEESEPESATLTADRPFIVLIRDRPTGAVLFLGRVMDPS